MRLLLFVVVVVPLILYVVRLGEKTDAFIISTRCTNSERSSRVFQPAVVRPSSSSSSLSSLMFVSQQRRTNVVQQQQPKVSLLFATIDNNTRNNNSVTTTTTTTIQEDTPIVSSLSPSPDTTTTTTTNNYNNEFFKYGYIATQTRDDFPILERTSSETLKPIVYLDSAATSQKPYAVVEAIENYYTQYNANVHRGAHTLSREATAAYEAAREKVQQFVGAASRNEIIFTSGATDSLNLVAQSYGRTFLKDGDEIILTVAEHHANLVPWQMLAEEKNIKLRFIDIDETTGCLQWDQLDTLIDPSKTKIISFQHVSNVLGCVNPVTDIVQKVRAINPNIRIILDACQSVPHMVVNVQELDIDFMVGSAHKMCGPTGIGFLYGKEHLLNSMPPYKGGGEMIDYVTLEKSTYLPAPSRFEAGTPPIAQAVGFAAAIDYITTIGIKNIELYEHELGQYLYEQLQYHIPELYLIGPKVTAHDTSLPQRVALCAFHHPTVHPSDLSTFLDIEGIAIRAGHHCCQPLHTRLGISHSARVSLYFYNTKEEIDFFVQELRKTINFFTGQIESFGSSNANGEEKDGFVPFI